MHVKLDEFIEDWNTDDSEYSGDDYIEDAIDDAVFTVLEKYRKTKSPDEIMSLIKKKLTSKPNNLTEGEDFTTDDISEIINDYKYYWSH